MNSYEINRHGKSRNRQTFWLKEIAQQLAEYNEARRIERAYSATKNAHKYQFDPITARCKVCGEPQLSQQHSRGVHEFSPIVPDSHYCEICGDTRESSLHHQGKFIPSGPPRQG